MLKRALIFLGSAALLAAPASAQLREAALPDILQSYKDCFAATDSGSISASSLEELGWARATMRDGDGSTIEGGPIIYGHSERAPIIILSNLSSDSFCVVNARIESFDTYNEFKAAFGGKLPDANENGEILFGAQGRIVQIAPTGSREAPAMRLVVGTRTENK